MRLLLPYTAALLSAVWISSAAALGLGDISVQSGLNQRLSATIPVSLTEASDLESLRVALASNAEFERAGLERSVFLSSLKFEVVDDGGAPRVRVSSNEIAQEPILMLLVEARDTGSRVLREYTIFLDPPNYTPPTVALDASASAPAQPASAAVPPTPAPAAADFYQTAEEAERSATVEAVVSTPSLAPTPQPTPVPTPVVSETPSDVPEAVTVGTEGGQYGPVAPGQTLWSIATAMRPGSAVTMDQVLLAIYRGNPSAFQGGINGLMKGVMLNVPSLQEMEAVDAATARREVASLRGLTSPAPSRAAVVPTPMPTPVATPIPTLEPTPIYIDEPEPDSALESEADAGFDAASGDVADDTAMPAMVDEPAEEQVYAVDDGMSDEAADESVSDAEAFSEPTPAPQPSPVVSEEDIVVDDIAPRQESGLLETLLMPLVLGLLVILGVGYLVSRVLARRKAAIGGDESDSVPAPVQKPASSVAKPEAAVAAAVASATAGAPVASALDQPEQPYEEQLPEAPAPAEDFEATQMFEAPPVPEMPAAASPAPEPVDFDLTGQFEAQTVKIDLDANDPVSEADFHLAYGLYDEAAMLLSQALAQEPQRADIHVKLAETYFAAGKPAEFEAAAVAAQPLVSTSEWQKIAIMGQQLCPDVPLFQQVDSSVASTDFDLDEPAAPAVVDVTEPSAPAPSAEKLDSGDTLDFNLDAFDLPDVPASADAPADLTATGEPGLEFDLSQFDLSEPSPVPEPAAQSHDNTMAFEIEPPAESVEPVGDVAPPSDDNALAFELDSVDLETPGPDGGEMPAAEPEASADFELDLSEFDIDAPSLEAASDSSASMPDIQEPAPETGEAVAPTVSDVSTSEADLAFDADNALSLDDVDLGEMPAAGDAVGDEAGTKLDLARAYVDMGDHEMARALLDEVLQQGNEQQQADAQALIARLG